MLIRWIARPDACDECKAIAAGSPYEKLPTWPGLGDTSCVCRCSVEGARAGNVMAMAGEPVSSPTDSEIRATPPPKRGASSRIKAAAPEPEPEFVSAAPHSAAPNTTTFVAEEVPVESRPLRMPSLPSLTSFRVKPLERRWAFALGALIVVAAFVALFSTGH